MGQASEKNKGKFFKPRRLLHRVGNTQFYNASNHLKQGQLRTRTVLSNIGGFLQQITTSNSILLSWHSQSMTQTVFIEFLS